MKKPNGVVAGGLGASFQISLAVLVQAMAVRRHGCSMMVVMAVMEAGLHLIKSYWQTGPVSNLFLLYRCMQAENESVSKVWKIVALSFFAAALCIVTAAQDRPWERYGNAPNSSASTPSDARIDINHASLDELLKVPGMTKVWAGRIVRFRPYRTKLDLLDRGILSSQAYDRVKDQIIAHRQKQ
jgi:DNA uptake protein ComE-like DNA-binding protein